MITDLHESSTSKKQLNEQRQRRQDDDLYDNDYTSGLSSADRQQPQQHKMSMTTNVSVYDPEISKAEQQQQQRDTFMTQEKQSDDHLLHQLVFQTIPEIFRFAPPIVAQFVSHQVSELLLLFDGDDDDKNASDACDADDIESDNENDDDNGLLQLSPKLKHWLRTSLSEHLLALVNGPFQSTRLIAGKSTSISRDIIDRFEQSILLLDLPKQTPFPGKTENTATSSSSISTTQKTTASSTTTLKHQNKVSSFNTSIATFNSLADFYSTFESLMQYFGSELLFGDVFEKLIALEYEEIFQSALDEEEIARGRRNLKTIPGTTKEVQSCEIENRRHRRDELFFAKRRERIEIEAAKVLATGQLVVFCFVAFGQDLVSRFTASIDESSKVIGVEETLKKMTQQYETLVQQRDSAADVVVAVENPVSNSESENGHDDHEEDDDYHHHHQQQQNLHEQKRICADFLSSRYRWEYDIDSKKVVSSKIKLSLLSPSSSNNYNTNSAASLSSLDKSHAAITSSSSSPAKKALLTNSFSSSTTTMLKRDATKTKDESVSSASTSTPLSSPTSSKSMKPICSFCRMQKEAVMKLYTQNETWR